MKKYNIGEQKLNTRRIRGNGILDRRPQQINTLLKFLGKQEIIKLEVCRVPVVSIIQKLINVLSLGRFKKELTKLNYDTVFHLYLIIHLKNGAIFSIEKNQRVNVIHGKKQGGVCKEIQFSGKTLNEFYFNAENRRIPGFYRYDAFKDNCQKWIFDILNSNGITEFNPFVLQNVSSLVPNLIKKFSKGLTDIAGLADLAVKG